jgi:hypothetical protein
MQTTGLKEFDQLPSVSSCRRIDFDQAQVLTLRSFPPQHVLRVSGNKPFVNMEVSLTPLVFIQQPEYWGIEVIGCLPGIGLPALAPYSVSLRLAGTIGTKGIEVLGATGTKKIDLGPPPDWLVTSLDANTFELNGPDLRVTFAVLRRASAGPRLDVVFGQRKLTFEQDRIHIAQSAIGLELTVVLESVDDGDTLTLTIVLPTVNLAGEAEQPVRTFAVLTTIRGSIGGPALIKGALQTYRTVGLRGRALHVEE